MSPTRLLLPVLAFAAVAPGVGAQTVGIASWYGERHDGRRTSSGETFDQEGMTAASRVLPLGSHVRVTMNDTGESVVVKINDRMGGRTAIIDLSKGAARQIGLLGRGRGLVSIDAAGSQPVEVAEASEDETADLPDPSPAIRRRAARRAVASRTCCHGASVILAHDAIHRHRPERRRA